MVTVQLRPSFLFSEYSQLGLTEVTTDTADTTDYY